MKAPLFDWLRTVLSKQKAPLAQVAPTYPAVEIDAGLNDCCAVVSRLRGRRFLMTNAPPIPLPGCDQAKCKCRYVRFSDRRSENRRGDDYGILNPLFTADEKRQKSGGRRVADMNEDEVADDSGLGKGSGT